LYSDFITSAEFVELWNQVSEELEIQPKTKSVSSALKETPAHQNTKDAEKKPSLLKTLLNNSPPSTKTIMTASTSTKKHNVPISSTPVVSEENDRKILEVPFKG
jgi:phage regulator Rha-like protein